jgi:hypothetical protein
MPFGAWLQSAKDREAYEESANYFVNIWMAVKTTLPSKERRIVCGSNF